MLEEYFVSKSDECCIKNEEFCDKNGGGVLVFVFVSINLDLLFIIINRFTFQ